MSNLNRADQDNVRLISRDIATATPPFNSLQGAHLAVQNSSVACQDHPFAGRQLTFVLNEQQEPGGPYWWYPMSTVRQSCTNTAASAPGDVRFRNCDGHRLGLMTLDSTSAGYHPPSFHSLLRMHFERLVMGPDRVLGRGAQPPSVLPLQH